MTRLTYSSAGFIRSLQISRITLFAFVEGWSDRFFYDRVCNEASRERRIEYEVRTASELPGGTGGKAKLVHFFIRMRERGLLLHEFKGKRLAIIFFLDKDIDDLLRTRKQSIHVTYTELYELENQLFRHTDMSEVAAVAAPLDVNSLRAQIGSQNQWMLRAATEWKDWVKLCILERILRVNSGCNYSRQSQINDGPYGGIDAERLSDAFTTLKAASGRTDEQVAKAREWVDRRVENFYALGEYDRVFKGSWYTRFLVEDIRRAAGPRPFPRNGLEDRLLTAAAAKVDFTSAWVHRFTARVSFIVDALLA